MKTDSVLAQLNMNSETEHAGPSVTVSTSLNMKGQAREHQAFEEKQRNN